MRQIPVRALTFKDVQKSGQRTDAVAGNPTLDNQPIRIGDHRKPKVRRQNSIHFRTEELPEPLVSFKMKNITGQKKEQRHMKRVDDFLSRTDQPDMAQHDQYDADSFSRIDPFLPVGRIGGQIHLVPLPVNKMNESGLSPYGNRKQCGL